MTPLHARALLHELQATGKLGRPCPSAPPSPCIVAAKDPAADTQDFLWSAIEMSSLTDEGAEKVRVIVQPHHDCLANCQSFTEVFLDWQVINIQLEEAT